MRQASLIAAFVVSFTVACGSETPSIEGGAAGGGAPSSGGFGGGASPPAAAPKPGSGSFCDGKGGIALPGTNLCTSDLASRTFRFGVCSCKDLTLSGRLVTSSFDSATGKSNAKGGSIGTNGALTNSGGSQIGGTSWSAKETIFSGFATVAGHLRAGGGVTGNGSTEVAGDLFSPTAPRGQVSVLGAKHVPATVAAPCDCDAPLPIAAYIAAFEKDNDDAAIGLAPGALAAIDGPKEVSLPCGRYYLDAIGGGGNLKLAIGGRVALFVRGDVSMGGSLSLELAPGAQLDVFVGGSFVTSGGNEVGNLAAPATVRMYVAGPRVTFDGSATIAANVYAPNAVVDTGGSLRARGAVAAKAFTASGSVDVAYDEAILAVEGCAAPGAPCKTCNDCGGASPSCNGGTCGACKTDADCCAPLSCHDGACVAPIK